MAKKRRESRQPPDDPVDHDESIDISTMASILSAEYPLIDLALIIALLSDHDVATLQSHLPEIREQLGILEATLIPDLEVENTTAKISDSGLNDKMGETKLGDASRSKERISSRSGSASQMSRSTSTSGKSTSGKSGKSTTTTPTSVLDDESEFEEEVSLLNALFPTLSERMIRDTLVMEGSVLSTIDHLLSLEYIRDREDIWGDDPELTTGPDHQNSGPLSEALPPRPTASPRKSKKKQHTVPLLDTLQRRSAPPSAKSSRSNSPSRAAPSGPSSNAWGTIASLADYLSDTIHSQSSTYFLAYFHSPLHHSAYAAVRASLVDLPSSTHRPNGSQSDGKGTKILQDLDGMSLLDQDDEMTRGDLELCARAVGDDVAAVMDLMDLLTDIAQWPGDDDLQRYDAKAQPASPRTELEAGPSRPATSMAKAPFNQNRFLTRPQPTKPPESVPTTEKVVVGSKPASSLYRTAHDDFGTSYPPIPPIKRHGDSGRQIHPLNWRVVDHSRHSPRRSLHPYASHIPSYARGQTPHDATPGSLFQTHQTSIDTYLSHANAERTRRQDAILAAGRHFNSAGGKAVNGAVAGHYALQARQAGDKAREWELKAARVLVGSQLDTTGHTIDLHHLTIEQGTTVACEVIERWYEGERVRVGGGSGGSGQAEGFAPTRGLSVIVGVGRHSAGQKGVLGPAVAHALENAGWKVDRGENSRGYLVVRGKR